LNRETNQSPAPLDEWVGRYAELQPGGAGHPGAWLGIPLLVASVIGMLFSAPVPAAFRDISPAINYATLFIMATFVYYCILSVSLGLGALVFLLVATVPSVWADRADLPLAPAATVLFVTVFAWQLAGTKLATGRMLVVRNLQYLMLGPMWLLREVYRRLGLAY
jgi:uncharacterized membrane protein YGL010W